jgi:hypothetical protein
MITSEFRMGKQEKNDRPGIIARHDHDQLSAKKAGDIDLLE